MLAHDGAHPRSFDPLADDLLDVLRGVAVQLAVHDDYLAKTETLSVNSMTPMDFAAPFGGYKQSGIGRELGPEGLEGYIEYKTITLPAG